MRLDPGELVFVFKELSKHRRTFDEWRSFCGIGLQSLGGCGPREACMLARSLARVGFRHHQLLDKLLDLGAHPALETSQRIQFLVDLSKLNFLQADYLLKVLPLLEVGTCEDHQLSLLLKVLARARLPALPVVQEILDLLDENRLALMDPRSLVAILFQLARLSLHLEVSIPLHRYLSDFSQREICNALWALVAQENLEMVQLLLSKVTPGSRNPVESHMVLLAQHFVNPKCDLQPVGLRPKKSKEQTKFARALTVLKVRFEEEFLVPPYLVDLYLPDFQLLLEIDGYAHYYQHSHQITAKTLIKRRILKRKGWRILSFPYFHECWSFSHPQKVDFLADVLGQFGQP